MFLLRWIRNLAMLALAVCLGGGVYLAHDGYEQYREALEEKSLSQMAEEIKGKEGYTSLEDMPQMYVSAVISAEDKRFYRHPGIDALAIGRAVYHDLKARSFVEGGSTITQQLAKNMYFTQEKALTRKAAEAFMAFALEREFTKDEILELYLNSIFFGNGYTTASQASRGYFGKELWELEEGECVMLAGIPNAPSAYNPVDNPRLAYERQQQVYRLMAENAA